MSKRKTNYGMARLVADWLSQLEQDAEAMASMRLSDPRSSEESRADANTILQMAPRLRALLISTRGIEIAWLGLRIGQAAGSLPRNRLVSQAEAAQQARAEGASGKSRRRNTEAQGDREGGSAQIPQRKQEEHADICPRPGC